MPPSASVTSPRTTPKPSADVEDAASIKSASPTGTTNSLGTKRKRVTEPKFYAVKVGNRPGIYQTWTECLDQVRGFKNATFKSFATLTDAERFLNGIDSYLGGSSLSSYKFYAVKNGRVPGIYMDWPSAQKQIVGWTKPRHKCFSTREEAQRFLEGDDRTTMESAALSESVITTPCRTSDTTETNMKASALKKVKKLTSLTNTRSPKPVIDEYNEDDYEPGTGPLPPGAEDGFDPNIMLDAESGHVVYKNAVQRKAAKLQASETTEGGMLRIYTDGSSLRNGAQGALAGVGVYFGPSDERNISEPLPGARQTNQRAELTAISRALDIIPRDRNATIITDSRYAIDCLTVWYLNWRKNGWKTSAGKAVENRDLIENVLAKIEERTSLQVLTLFEWIKGHASHTGNVEADKLAVDGARNSMR